MTRPVKSGWNCEVRLERNCPRRSSVCFPGHPALVSVGVGGGVGGVGAAAAGGEGHDAGLGLGEGPAGGLLGFVVVAAAGADVAFTGSAAAVVGARVVEVALGGGAAAAGVGAGRVPDFDEVAEC